MAALSLHEEQWEYVRTLLPADLEDSARRTKALVRCRNVPDAAALMRMALAYAVSGLSLKDVAAWASAMELAEISGPDATLINGPGKKAVQWRAHVLVNPSTGGFRSVELTDDSGGEKLARHRVEKGELVLGDRAYGTARGVCAVRQAEAHVVVRFNPVTLRTCDEKRRRIFLQEREAQLPATGAVEVNILLPTPPERTKSHKTWDSSKAIAWIPVRAIAARTRNAEVIWILTTLTAAELPARAVLGLYRLRWQIELFFKRLKSLLHLDTLPSREGPTAKSWMLARLIAAALAQRLVQPSGPLSPWGYQLRELRADQ